MNRFDPANQGLWVCGQRQEASTTSPTSKKRHRQKRTTDVLQKPDKSECYRHTLPPSGHPRRSGVHGTYGSLHLLTFGCRTIALGCKSSFCVRASAEACRTPGTSRQSSNGLRKSRTSIGDGSRCWMHLVPDQVSEFSRSDAVRVPCCPLSVQPLARAAALSASMSARFKLPPPSKVNRLIQHRNLCARCSTLAIRDGRL